MVGSSRSPRRHSLRERTAIPAGGPGDDRRAEPSDDAPDTAMPDDGTTGADLPGVLGAPTTVVVDAANCVGSVPDGWWRDRAGATRRLRDALDPEGLGRDLQLDATPALVLVVEGRARGVDSTATVQVVEAPGIGDDTIVGVVERLAELGESAVVVTADRELRSRVASRGARTVGPRVVRSR